MQYSFLVPFVTARLRAVLPFAALAASIPGIRMWQGQGLTVEGHHMFAAVAAAGYQMPVGLGVSLMPMRHPFLAAVEARSVALLTGQPVVAGFGPGGRSLQRALLGRPYASPLAASREYLTIVRRLLTGLPVDHAGEYFTMHGQLPTVPARQVQLGLGVLRRGMAELAGEVADVAVTWLTPPHYVRDVLRPAVDAAAARAGRPGACRVTVMAPVALARPHRDPVGLVLASNAGHLRAPHYQAMLRAAGIPATGTDLATDAKEVLRGSAFGYGDLDEIDALAAEYAAAGVDELCLNLVGVASAHGPQAALDDLTTMLNRLRGVPA